MIILGTGAKKSRIEGAVVGLQRTKSQSQKEWDTFPEIIHPTNLQRSPFFMGKLTVNGHFQ
jgi:hypothetical protein